MSVHQHFGIFLTLLQGLGNSDGITQHVIENEQLNYILRNSSMESSI